MQTRTPDLGRGLPLNGEALLTQPAMSEYPLRGAAAARRPANSAFRATATSVPRLLLRLLFLAVELVLYGAGWIGVTTGPVRGRAAR
jgi:hypothetical protein